MSRFTYQTPQDESTTVEFELTDGELRLGELRFPCDGKAVWLDGRRVPFAVSRHKELLSVWLDGEVYSFTSHNPRQRSSGAGHAGSGSGSVTAQMPGKILSLAVQVGDTVSAGQNLLIMESMKMELALNAPIDGTVESVEVSVGQMVAQGDLLVGIAAE